MFVQQGQPVLILGGTGSGKSTVNDELRGVINSKKIAVEKINLTANSTAEPVQQFVESKLF
jgi:energy-coupling factor transporter ATP-binding protein EcfA2